ncbi:MAG: hypothetical protein ABIB47_06235 [Candidatus Woesearchaeota archaeon]
MTFKNHLIKTGVAAYMGASLFAGPCTAKRLYDWQTNNPNNDPYPGHNMVRMEEVIGAVGAGLVGLCVTGGMLMLLAIGANISKLKK